MTQNLWRSIANLAKRQVLVVITARMRGRGMEWGDVMQYIRRAASAALPLDAAHRSVKRAQCRCHGSGADGAEEVEGRASLRCGRVRATEAKVVGGVLVSATVSAT